MSCPYQLRGVCSCGLAEEGQGVHTWYYVGTSFPARWNEVGVAEHKCATPAMRRSIAHAPLGVNQGLCGIIRYGSHFLNERYGSHIPRLTESGIRLSADTAGDSPDGGESEDGYVGQLPGHVAAQFANVGLTPFVGGASADTRLAVQTGTTVVGHDAGKSQNSTDCGTSHNPATTMGFEQ